MRDDFLTADWAQQHGHLTETIRRSLGNIGEGLARLHAHQFDAPWRDDTTPAARHAACPGS